ncbi:MAG: DUF2232 domain-containing protein [Candidatus Zixiibacteriota bacterium]|nr:MAG: DUF2232 domain-containing protein [candidate division Zixibacteria bacterium]
MNLTDSKTPEEAVPKAVAGRQPRWEPYLIVAAMFTYSILAGLASNPESLGASIVVSTLAYIVAIYVYYGVARLAFVNRNYLLWSSGVLAFLISYSFTGLADLWSLITGWSMILVAGTVLGRFSQSGFDQSRVFLFSLLLVAAFAIAQYFPMWQQMMSVMQGMFEKMVDDARQNLVTLGYGADAVRHGLDSTEKTLKALVRLIPSLTVLGAVFPFTIAYLIFNWRLDRNSYPGKTVAPFIRWKMPFAVTPVLIITILIRLVGSNPLKLVADNILVFLSLFYSITGLALIEFYLRKFKFSAFLKVTFYIIFLMSQFIGLFAAAFLGFVDSFVDWRKVQQLSLEEK